MDCTADMLLVFVWGLWDSEEQHREWNGIYILRFALRCPRGSLISYKNEEQTSCAVHSQSCSSLSQRQSRPIQKRGADQLCSPFPVLLLAAQRQSRPIQSEEHQFCEALLTERTVCGMCMQSC